MALDLRAHRAQARAGLARGDDVAQAQRRRVDAGVARAAGQVRRERQRAVDRREPQAGDEVEQPLRLADAHGHDGRARGLERHVVGDAAGVERVVEAVGDDVVVAHARDGEGGAADGRVGLVVCAREPDGHRIPGRPRCDVQAHERLGGTRTGARRRAAARPARRAAAPWSAAGRPRATARRPAARGRRASCAPGRRAGLAAPRHRPRAHASRRRQRGAPVRPPGPLRATRRAARVGGPLVAMLARGECRVRWRRVRSLRGSLRRMTQGTQDASRRRRPGGPSWRPPRG